VSATADQVAWDLSALYDGIDDPELERDSTAALEGAKAFRSRYGGRVVELSGSELAQAVDELERLRSMVDRVRLFAQLGFDANTQDEHFARLLGLARERQTAVENELRPFEIEWAGVDDAHAARIFDAPELERVRHYLASRRRFKPYLLSEGEERVAAEKSLSGALAWERLFSELLSSIRVPLDGEEVSLDEARERLRIIPSRSDRQTVAEAITRALEPNIRLRSLVLNTVASDRAIDDGLRGYPTWISERNLQNEITDAAAQALIDAVVSRYDIVHRHFRLRAQLLGLPKLADYDRFAPVGEDVTAVDWDDARGLAVEAFGAFSPGAGEIVDRFFEERWIDAAPRPGKVPGAYCAMQVAGAHPFILMNFSGSRDSALTLAHELGHGLHAVLAADRGYLNLEFPLTFVEAASVFGETLVFQALLERATTDRERLELLVSRIDGAVGTVFGTVTWNRLEDAVHTGRREHGELSVEHINEHWEAAARAMNGDAVEITPGFRTWWSYVPHFVAVPGYMYAYAFGYLLSLSIYERYREQGDALVEPILDMLRAGSSDSPDRLAARLGLDLADPQFWHRGLDAIEQQVVEAEALASASAPSN
jgi:oligoendopeptidase F